MNVCGRRRGAGKNCQLSVWLEEYNTVLSSVGSPGYVTCWPKENCKNQLIAFWDMLQESYFFQLSLRDSHHFIVGRTQPRNRGSPYNVWCVFDILPLWRGQSPLHPRRPPTKFAAGWATRPPAKPAAPDEVFVIICRHSFLICHSMLNSKVTFSVPAVATVPRFPPKGPVNPLLLLLGRRPGLPPGGGGRLPGGPRPRPRPKPLSSMMWIMS